jgi:hypothetical protein
MALTFSWELLRVLLLCPALALQLAVGAFMSLRGISKTLALPISDLVHRFLEN